MATAITKLPYMGKPKDDNPSTAEVPYKSMEIPFSRLHAHHIERVEAELNEHDDPLNILMAKVTRLARLLNCTEAQAEEIIFDRI